ncbi:hypothetical protein ACLBWS_17400 [Brucellaceae bacterium D45D]
MTLSRREWPLGIVDMDYEVPVQLKIAADSVLALQLRFSVSSESMGFHDSEAMDDGIID